MKKFLIAILVLGILGGGGCGVYYYFFENSASPTERVSSTADNAVYVDSVSSITGFGSGNGLRDRFGGEVSPQAILEVKLEQDHSVKECFVKEGDIIREGQRLFVYDTQEDEDKLAQAEINIEKAQSDIEVAEKSIAQMERERKNASADDQLMYTTSILQSQNEIKQNEYEIRTTELEMEQLREAIKNATVNAEMGGIVQKISDPNSSSQDYYGSSGDSAYITILAEGDFRIKGTINEQNIQLIEIGMPMVVYSRVDNTKTWTGIITDINTDNTEDNDSNNMYYGYYGMNESGSSNYTFYVELDSSEGLILGQHVYLEQDAGQTEEKEGLWLEEYYIIQEDGHAYVWWASTSNLIEKHEITLGDYDEELMEYQIVDGLAADDYIAYPMESISEGDPVIYNDFVSPDMMSNDIDASYLNDGNWDASNLDDGEWDDDGWDDVWDDDDWDDEDFE